MKKIFAMTSALLFLSALPAQAGGLEGLWLTENKRSVVEIKPCDDKLCGYIHWIIEGGMQYDAKNPDESLRGAPMCGLKILWGMSLDGDKRAENGKIYKADDGDIYDSYIELTSEDELKVRGFMGLSFLGKTQHWTRVLPDDYAQCTMPKTDG